MLDDSHWKVLLGVGAGLLSLLILNDYKQAKIVRKKEEKQAKKICLTGGPCGGKTEGVAWIYNALQQKNVACLIVPEAATILASGGALLNFQDYSWQQMIDFQYSLMKVQIGLEEIMTHIANIRCASTPIILCDRGLLDGKAYLQLDAWKEMLKKYDLREEDMLKRYHMVVHMVTLADGVHDQYRNKKTRLESIEQAVQIDRRLKEAWTNHPLRFVIDNEYLKSFDQKKAALMLFIQKEIEQQKTFSMHRKSSALDYDMYLKRKQKLKTKMTEKIDRKLSG